ncbi:MAG: nucleoside triphosphate pyrophosphohydrolase [Ruminococcaceae bacterium]|nr:nucleoside triphosphate pyrophosphohydrolase [Oscillospiraceae bacterium]
MVYLKADSAKNKYDMEQFINIMKMLRAPDGCPWDKEQTHSSIRNNFLEEVYEVVDAIDRDSTEDMREELGDVLMQVVFHAVMAEEENRFDFSDVVNEVCQKLVYRHPHVFGDVKADTSEKVLDNWEKLKRTEKSQSTYTDTLKSVPLAFPSLMRAQKLQKRASKAGYDWTSAEEAFGKINEETTELKEAMADADKAEIAEEIGDLLFSVVNVARLLGVDCEEALHRSNDKFISRFSKAEETIIKDGKNIKQLSAAELDEYWQSAKKNDFIQ